MSTTSEKLDRIIELLEEGIPVPGPCGAEFVTTITWPGREPRRQVTRCNLTANHAGLHTDGAGSQWARDEQTRDAIEQRSRYRALRADVEAYINRVNPTATERAMGRWLLDRDDERGRQ